MDKLESLLKKEVEQEAVSEVGKIVKPYYKRIVRQLGFMNITPDYIREKSSLIGHSLINAENKKAVRAKNLSSFLSVERNRPSRHVAFTAIHRIKIQCHRLVSTI